MGLKKVGRKVGTFVTKPFKKPPRPYIAPAPPEQPSTPRRPPIMEPPPPRKRSPASPFPPVESQILPDPSRFFSPDLCSSALPTNSFFQNFVLKNGDQPEYIHPYLVKFASSSLSISYPPRFANSTFIYQIFNADLTISAASQNAYSDSQSPHIISSFSDLSVTVDLPSSNLRCFLVRGSPFLTCAVSRGSCLSISTIHAIISFTSNSSLTKYTVKLNNNQTWLIYTSSPIELSHDLSTIRSNSFSGIIRFALLPESDQGYEAVLDRCSSCYPVSGGAVFTGPYSLEYRWERKGWGDLLMLAHPLHLQMLSNEHGGQVKVLNDFKYRSIDGDLVGVVGDSWSLRSEPVSVTWHSIRGVREESHPEIITALCKDVEALNSSSISTNSSYFYGKLIARGARLALIAEEVSYPDVIPAVRNFLKQTIEPWLNGNFNGNGFLYEGRWGGIVTKQGAADSGADFGFGLYNDHHYHLGYFLYGIAVLAKIDPAWGRKYRPQAYSLMADFMNLGRRANSSYTRLRCFDLYKLHSWASGLTEFADGRNQESTSEAINAYYSAALMGLAYGDSHLVSMGSTLTALEIQAAKTWWHVKEGNNMYEAVFSSHNKMMGVLWANKRDSALWFAPPDWRECRLGIQVLPLSPITEAVFSDVEFVKDLVNWTMPALQREGVGEGWKGFVYALEGTYDRESALEKIRSLQGFDDGNSFSNLLWWIHSSGHDEAEGCGEWGRHCWFGHYCH